jgi:predicted kinase
MEMLTTNEVEVIDQPIELENNSNFLFNDNWYKKHPDKILGMPYESSGRFGKVTKYSGNIEVLSRIQVDEFFVGANKSLNDPLASVSYEINVSGELIKPEIQKMVEEVIEKSEKEKNKKRKVNIVDEDALVKPQLEINTFFDTFYKINPEISKEEIEVYVWYKSSIGKPLSKNYVALFKEDYFADFENLRETYDYSKFVKDETITNWLENGLLCYFKGQLLPTFEYISGNMYDKKIQLEQDSQYIIDKYGQDVLDKQKIVLQEGFRLVYEKRLLIGGENSLVILAYSKIATEFFIERIEEIPEGETFRIKKVTAGSDKNYGKPDVIKDLQVYSNRDRAIFEKINLQDAFGWWLLNKKPLLLEPISHLDIYKYYVLQSNVRAVAKNDSLEAKKKAEAEKAKLKASTQKEGERLFAIFLSTQLTASDKVRLETQWNIDYNNYLPIDLNKVPVAFTMAKYIFGKEEIVQPVKRDAIAFTMNNGTGVLAYDVGVGKTPSAIWTISSFLDAGYCKRPLIVVPNQVYRQFISEIKIFTPHINIIEGYNFGKDYIENFHGVDGQIEKVPEGSITIITYEGFENIGFSENTSNSLLSKLYEILNQGGESEKSEKQKASFEERLAQILGRGLKGGMFNIEDFGFDFMCYDEAHKMKKVFTSVKGEAESDEKGKTTRGKNPYAISSGSPSSIALKGFMINSYILQQNNNKNVLLLTATPFTNSPLEIFSMLAMVAYEQLANTNLANIKLFFDNYVKTSTELVINSKLKPEFKQVILGFNNLISLQSLIRRFILYKTGEEAGVVRPKKYVLPYLKEIIDGVVTEVTEERKVETYIQMTPQQKAMMEDIVSYVESGTPLGRSVDLGEDDEALDDDESADFTAGEEVDEDSLSDSEKRGVRTIKGLSYSRNLALSPYLYEYSGLGKNPTYKEYVESSPKLFYVMLCIKSVRDYHISKGQDVSGQVIYMDRGIRYFSLLKEYLINEIGYKPHEVGIIQSGLPKTGVRSKEYVKNLFNGEIYNEKTKEFEKVNTEQRIKVVIGSSTIKEGMNLQKYGTVLYNCFIDWNPTDIQQLEGRIWRQKNTFDAVRIVNALLVDSADIFLFQKLQEKTARLNTIWSTDGHSNVLKNEEFNTEELKYALIRDPRVIAELRLIEAKAKLTSDKLGFERQIEIVDNVKAACFVIQREFDDILKRISKYRDFNETKDRLVDALRLVALAIDTEKKQTDKGGKKIYSSWEVKYLKDEERENMSDMTEKFEKGWRFSDFAVAARDMKRYKTDFIDQYNIDFDINHYEYILDGYKKEVQGQIDAIQERLENLQSPENIAMLVQEAEEEKEKQKIAYKALPQLISDFGKLNYLLTNKKVIENKKVEYAQCPPIKQEGEFPNDPKAIEDLKVCIAKENQTKDFHYDENVGYTENRKKIHEKIISDLFANVKCINQGSKPIAIFTGGSPASGKSTFLKKHAKYLLSENIFKLDADAIREKLPEYEGWNANSTHSETQDIVNEVLNFLGSEGCRYDLIYDGTMNKAKKYFPLINKVKQLGYKTFIIFMVIPYAEAKRRNLQRYKTSGRYVPEEVIDDFFTMENGRTKGEIALDALKPIVDGYIIADGLTGDIIEFGGEELPQNVEPEKYTDVAVPLNINKNENQDLLDTIAGLEFLAEDGNQDAIDTIEGLKLLI